MIAYSRRGALNGKLTVPGSKSHTIRAVMLGVLAEGTTVIHNPLPSEDGLAAANAAKAFGGALAMDGACGCWTVTGTNGRPIPPAQPIDTMNSGTTTSFTLGVAALAEGRTTITGDEQICRRPWKAETQALEELGARCVHLRPGSPCPPVEVTGPMTGGTAHLDGFNSQHVSGILLSAPLLKSGQEVRLEVADPLEQPYIQMTLDWISRFGGKVDYTKDYKHFHIAGGQRYSAREVTIPADWSGVAFPLVAAVCTPSRLTISGVDFFDSQGDKEVVDILIRMGADIVKDTKNGRLIIRGGKPLRGTTVDLGAIPDSLPALCIAAAYAQGDTRFVNLAHVRVKESDRVAVMDEVLSACGADIEITADSMTIHGGRPLHGAVVPSHGDHRIAMAMTVCGLLCDGEMQVLDAQCAAVSFPRFFEVMNEAGAGFRTK